MNANRRPIDPRREKIALHRFSDELILEAEWVKKSHDIGIQCWILDEIALARIHGASLAACCEMLDLNPRTPQRWAKRRQNKLFEVGF